MSVAGTVSSIKLSAFLSFFHFLWISHHRWVVSWMLRMHYVSLLQSVMTSRQVSTAFLTTTIFFFQNQTFHTLQYSPHWWLVCPPHLAVFQRNKLFSFLCFFTQYNYQPASMYWHRLVCFTRAYCLQLYLAWITICLSFLKIFFCVFCCANFGTVTF